MTRPYAFHDFPQDKFPMQLMLYNLDQSETVPVWVASIDGPGALEIPGTGTENTKVVIKYGDGMIVEYKAGSSTVLRRRDCKNCGEEGPHFVPARDGIPGHFACLLKLRKENGG